MSPQIKAHLFHLSRLLGLAVVEGPKARTGRIRDLIVQAGGAEARVTGLVVEDRSGKERRIPAEAVVRVGVREVRLKEPLAGLPDKAVSPNEILLAEHLLDKKVIDTHRKKVLRVSDIEIREKEGELVVVAVDAGLAGMVRRLGFPLKGPGLMRRIPWQDMEPLEAEVKAAFQRLGDLHPADVADLVEELPPAQASDIMEKLDPETAAEVLPEMESEMQADLVEHLTTGKAADILDEMRPDDAADLLGDLPRDVAEEILGDMQKKEKEEVQELLRHGEDTAGGIMNSEFVALPEAMTAEGAIQKLRELAPGPEMAYYLYVVDGEEKLLGVLPLRNLIIARPETLLREIMTPEVISVRTGTAFKKVADLFAKYNLLALPVVDAEGKLEGAVTVDDVMEKMVPRVWRKKRPRKFS
jgi:CBS domain-containing protein